MVGCLVTDAECDLPGLEERVALVVENEKAKEALQELQIDRTIVANKEQELERAIRVGDFLSRLG